MGILVAWAAMIYIRQLQKQEEKRMEEQQKLCTKLKQKIYANTENSVVDSELCQCDCIPKIFKLIDECFTDFKKYLEQRIEEEKEKELKARDEQRYTSSNFAQARQETFDEILHLIGSFNEV